MFRSPTTGTTASGLTSDDGHYELGVMEKGEGVPPGEYEVYIVEDRGGWDNPRPRTIHAAYENRKTSGLSCVVEAGRDTTYDITLKR